MIVRLDKKIRSYYAAPHTFTKQNPEQKVSAKMGRYLLGTGYFKEIAGSDDDIDDAEEEKEETDAEVEASEQKKLYDESQEEAKKKSTKKDK